MASTGTGVAAASPPERRRLATSLRSALSTASAARMERSEKSGNLQVRRMVQVRSAVRDEEQSTEWQERTFAGALVLVRRSASPRAGSRRCCTKSRRRTSPVSPWWWGREASREERRSFRCVSGFKRRAPELGRSSCTGARSKNAHAPSWLVRGVKYAEPAKLVSRKILSFCEKKTPA